MSSGPVSGDVVFGMFAPNCAATPAGILSAQNVTLCGPPVTLVNLIPSPTLIVIVDGSNRYPCASPIIFTSTVLPVIAAAVPAAAAPAGAAPPAVAAAGAAAAVVSAGLAALLSPVLSPPPHAVSDIALAASTSP